MYIAMTHQWMQEDPISISAGDSNFRRYVGNNFVNGIDTSGLIDDNPHFNANAGQAISINAPNLPVEFFYEFYQADAEAIIGYLHDILPRVRLAQANLTRLAASPFSQANSSIKSIVDYWFRGHLFSALMCNNFHNLDRALNSKDYKNISQLLDRIGFGLEHTSINFISLPKDEGPKREIAFVAKKVAPANVHLYGGFWTYTVGPSNPQEWVLLHELTHFFADTRDYGYLKKHTRAIWYYKSDNSDADRSYLPTLESEFNADTYTGYIENCYNTEEASSSSD